jgi:aspartyl/asparaginyl beta-hydroxylase (cupin superfamily)
VSSLTDPQPQAYSPPTAFDQTPSQQFGTAGIAAMGRPSLVTRRFMAIVAFVERLNLSHSNVGNPPIYDNQVFPWTKTIERDWRAIRTELDRVLIRQDELPGFHELSSDVANISKDRGWKTFLLCGYGFRSQANIDQCPETWRICQGIPGLTTAMFSILEPGKHLPPHRGPYNGVLRLHVGLIVPEPRDQLGIRVENETYRWKEGEAVIFDDAYEHEAWNKTPHTRVVLFVDFIKPLRFPANLLNWLLLHLAIFTPFIREGMDNQKTWEKRFYAEAEALRNR